MEAAIQGFFLKKVNLFMYTWEIPAVGLISSKTAGSMSAVLVGVGSFVAVFQVFFLFYYLLFCGFFGGTTLSDCFIVFSTLFILTYMERKFSREHSSRVDFLLISAIVSVAY